MGGGRASRRCLSGVPPRRSLPGCAPVARLVAAGHPEPTAILSPQRRKVERRPDVGGRGHPRDVTRAGPAAGVRPFRERAKRLAGSPSGGQPRALQPLASERHADAHQVPSADRPRRSPPRSPALRRGVRRRLRIRQRSARRRRPVRGADRGAGGCQAGRCADGARGLGRRLHRPGRDVLPVRLHGHHGDAVARWSATRPDDIDAPSRCWRPTEPTVSDDGKTITYKLRDDVKFSPPVNRDRDRRPTSSTRSSARCCPASPNGYAQTYLTGVVGFDDAVKQAQSDPTGGAPDISGNHRRRTTRPW